MAGTALARATHRAAASTATHFKCSLSTFTVRNPDYEDAIRRSFALQGLMGHLGARLTSVGPGEVTIEAPHSEGLTQQHGFFHAGASTSLVDSAGGYAAMSLMEAGVEPLAVEFKMTLLAPARGDILRATGRVLRSGRTLTFTEGTVWGVDSSTGVATKAAVMLQTAIASHKPAAER